MKNMRGDKNNAVERVIATHYRSILPCKAVGLTERSLGVFWTVFLRSPGSKSLQSRAPRLVR